MTGNGHWQHKIKDDPRVTRVGRLIRRTSIDELPQLINVIRGEMSLIGPRPELPQIVRDYEPWMHRRHLVRPGLTGWWQVRGRSDLPMHEHTDLDIYYVEHVSWRLDLRILKQTVRIVVCGLGAY
jgi:lipopolysaccharide/colanic/teichoic acid biosynthesis glycosyltransferase